jgi:hypothetical protein
MGIIDGVRLRQFKPSHRVASFCLAILLLLLVATLPMLAQKSGLALLLVLFVIGPFMIAHTFMGSYVPNVSAIYINTIGFVSMLIYFNEIIYRTFSLSERKGRKVRDRFIGFVVLVHTTAMYCYVEFYIKRP